jgi:hypothetical protein
MFNLDMLDQTREHWFSLSGPAQGVELLCRYASPAYGEKFRRTLLQKQIHIMVGDKTILATGRDADYVLEFCRHYIADWKGVSRGSDGKAEPYSPEACTRLLLALRSAFESVAGFIAQEEMYFSSNGSGPK